MFSEKDLIQIQKQGITVEEIENQIETFRHGIDFVELVKPATPGDGIENPDQHEIAAVIDYYDHQKDNSEAIKFVPASGAASRMFKSLFEALELAGKKGNSALKANEEIMKFFENLHEYPFYKDLETVLEGEGEKLEDLLKKENYVVILEHLLQEKGLNYGNLPKGLLKFHSYKTGNRTAFEEHYEEATFYLNDSQGNIKLHFTVSPEHMSLFSSLSEVLNEKYKNEKGLIFTTDFSIQRPSTDTIAVDLDNKPFRTEKGELLFRPGGHGALLNNLNDLEEALVFIGNIDNVSPDHNMDLRVKYKKFLGGFLLKKVNKIHTLLDRIDRGERGELLQKNILDIIEEISPQGLEELKSVKNDLFNEKAYHFLNRPIRVCGMVKNVGEPGGGPFWIKDKNGRISKQIIESSQINLDDNKQKELFHSSTHFNPVDLVCYIQNHKAEKFNLNQYSDPDMAFIARKSQGGKDLKALELPGLWNGSMAGWLTWFVDVPLESFTPVKTVFDLLRPEHQ
jgi:hypothetical protein